MLSRPICCQAQVSTWLHMRLSAADLQLINALGTNLHTGTRAARYCQLRLADNAQEPGDHVEQKPDSNQQSLRDMPGQWALQARVDMQGRIETVQVLMMAEQTLSFFWLQNQTSSVDQNGFHVHYIPQCKGDETQTYWQFCEVRVRVFWSFLSQFLCKPAF